LNSSVNISAPSLAPAVMDDDDEKRKKEDVMITPVIEQPKDIKTTKVHSYKDLVTTYQKKRGKRKPYKDIPSHVKNLCARSPTELVRKINSVTMAHAHEWFDRPSEEASKNTSTSSTTATSSLDSTATPSGDVETSSKMYRNLKILKGGISRDGVWRIVCSHSGYGKNKKVEKVKSLFNLNHDCSWVGYIANTESGWRVVAWRDVSFHKHECGIKCDPPSELRVKQRIVVQSIPDEVREKIIECYNVFGTAQSKLWTKTLQLTEEFYTNQGFDPTVDFGYHHFYTTLLRPMSITDDYVDPSQFLLSLQQEKENIGTMFMYSVGVLEELDTSKLMMGREILQSQETPIQEEKKKKKKTNHILNLKREREKMEKQLELNLELNENEDFMTALTQLKEVRKDLT